MILAVFFTATNILFGQFPVITRPQPSTLSPGVIIGNPTNRVNPTANIPGFSNFSNNSRQQLDMYKRNMLEIQRRNVEMQKMLSGNSQYFQGILLDLPSRIGMQGTQYYQETLEKLCGMLRGDLPLNLKDAVFAVENAYFENQLDYSEFNKSIDKLAETAQLKTMQDGYNWQNPITKNVMLFRVMVDTLDIKIPSRETSVVSYPMQYDFEDFWGREDWSNMFVSKLLTTNKGQCHSLPLLYLILCEEVGTEAHLAFSPSHSYIKFKDDSGNWHNLELTNGTIVTDAHIAGSGYVTAEAIKNKTYMEPQTKQQAIANCLFDLTMGYARKYGYDSFVKQCSDSILKYDANNIGGLMEKSNYETLRFRYVYQQIGQPPADVLKEYYPQVYELFEDVTATYKRIDDSGHRDMPKEAYEDWLNAVNEEKERREYDEKYNKVLRLMR